MSNVTLGRTGEDLVCRYLKKKGYRILEQNYRVRYGEIDIIAAKRKHTAFVEVKTRNSVQFGTPGEAVGIKKQKSIIAVAQQYIAQNGRADESYSFDVAEVLFQDGVPAIEYIENAFYE